MEIIGPFEMFSPRHIAYLRRRHDNLQDVTSADLDSIQTFCPAVIRDPLFIDYRRRADAGTLRRRPGRKPLTTTGWLRLWAARFAIEEEVSAIWQRRRAGTEPRQQSDMSPCLQAAEMVSREFRFNTTPEALHNRLSRGRFR